MDSKEKLKDQERVVLAIIMPPIIEQLRRDKKMSAVHTYGSTLRSFLLFSEGEKSLEEGALCLPTADDLFQPGILKSYETWLRCRKAKWATVSTYMRTLKAVYNRLVLNHEVVYNPQLFDDVYTKVEPTTKRALTAGQMHTLLATDVDALPKELQCILAYFLLTFLFRGMPFIDLAYLQKRDVCGNVITYCRHKTGRQITVRIPRIAEPLFERFRNTNTDSIFLFPILDIMMENKACSVKYLNNEQLYDCYARALRHFNSRLAKVASLLLPDAKLSSYTPRHTWATLAFYKGVTVGIISKALGHSSIKVTDTYLKPFEDNIIDSANDDLILSVMQSETEKEVA